MERPSFDFTLSLSSCNAIGAAAQHEVQELALLQSVVVCFSVAYHRVYEAPGAVAHCDGAAAKALFVYGTAQTLLNCPSVFGLFEAEMTCGVATTSIFLVTNIRKHDTKQYDRWHPLGLHMMPGIWSYLVATNHSALFF